jgi:hypothetical protein
MHYGTLMVDLILMTFDMERSILSVDLILV